MNQHFLKHAQIEITKVIFMIYITDKKMRRFAHLLLLFKITFDKRNKKPFSIWSKSSKILGSI
jgi:hypothetical protein